MCKKCCKNCYYSCCTIQDRDAIESRNCCTKFFLFIGFWLAITDIIWTIIDVSIEGTAFVTAIAVSMQLPFLVISLIIYVVEWITGDCKCLESTLMWIPPLCVISCFRCMGCCENTYNRCANGVHNLFNIGVWVTIFTGEMLITNHLKRIDVTSTVLTSVGVFIALCVWFTIFCKKRSIRKQKTKDAIELQAQSNEP
mmetsp:Transcript_31407/g.38578  ORF Transcript_31407/g.38578 Transcript_31407/m.38578 type:complete len:197 (+) Transcript_31407:37-627(+)